MRLSLPSVSASLRLQPADVLLLSSYKKKNREGAKFSGDYVIVSAASSFSAVFNRLFLQSSPAGGRARDRRNKHALKSSCVCFLGVVLVVRPLTQVKVVGDQSGAYAGNQFQKPRGPGEVPGTPYLTMQVRGPRSCSYLLCRRTRMARTRRGGGLFVM